VTASVNLDLFATQHRLDKTTTYEGMFNMINDMIDTKKQVKTYDIMAVKIVEEREESRIVMREVSEGLSDPSRFAAKQEMKQKHKRSIKRPVGRRN
jgi:hypothetical protein